MSVVRYQKRERAGKMATFLRAISAGKSISEAARCAEITRRTVYRWREADSDFEAKWHAASAPDGDPLEIEALRRAIDGVDKPVYRGGSLVGHVKDYSDSMLMFLLKAKYPEKYDRRGDGAKTGANASDEQTDLEGARDALLRKFTAATE
ncbi:MAG: helix-turn-helix domain-containing protein [Kordiimonadaceae bacterium]|nr:helix-turn-helix domain-containing protein [Kordiimonadaceae bacterium]